MKPFFALFCYVVFAGLFFGGCETAGSKSPPAAAPGPSNIVDSNKESAKKEPAYITVQHCLIAFKGTLPGKSITRSKEEARELAVQLLDKLKAGADFDEIIRQNTDDSPPGIYKMANFGEVADIENGVYNRGKMVPAFGDTGFPLAVGEYGLAEFDETKSEFGWHIVKRIK